MVFNDKLNHYLSPGNSRKLDIHFIVPDLRRQFGGSGGNIAYNLKMLGIETMILASVGTDSDPYIAWLNECGVDCTYLAKIEHSYTAQTFVTVDMADNQITAFHPGAMNFSHYNRIPRSENLILAAVSFDSIEGISNHALQLVEAGIPFIFDPGHTIYEFDGEELLKFTEQASWILVNQQEWEYIEQRTRLSPSQLAHRVQALIITLGEQGAAIYVQDTCYQIPPAVPRAGNDPVSCGDAFCAGLLYGLAKDIDWETTGRIASLMGAIKIEHHGSQNHKFTLDLFKARFKKNFGYALIV